MTVKGRPLQKPVKIHGQPIEALLENLKHPVNGVRHRTRVELSGRDSQAVIAATQKWMQGFNPDDETEAHHLLEALWMHQQHHVRNEELLNKLLQSKVKHAVIAASTVKHFWHNVDATGAAVSPRRRKSSSSNSLRPSTSARRIKKHTNWALWSISGIRTVRPAISRTAKATRTSILRWSAAPG